MASSNPLSDVLPWQLVAEGYAQDADVVMRAFSLEAVRRAQVGPDSHIIDVACGPGTLCCPAAAQVASVQAVDFSDNMLTQLRNRLHEAGIANVQLTQADGQALPFSDDRFDAGFSMFGVMFFPDKVKGLSELRRVVKPSQPVVVSSWGSPSDSPLIELMFGALAAADPTRQGPKYNELSWENPAVLEAAMRQAGFEQIQIEPYRTSVAVGEAEQFWLTMTRSNAPILLLRRAVGEDQWAEMESKALAFLRAKLTPGEEVSTTALLALGRA